MMGLTGLQVGVTATCDVENSVNSSGIQPCNKPTCTMLTPVYKRLVNSIIKNIRDTISEVIVFTDKFESLFKFEPFIVS